VPLVSYGGDSACQRLAVMALHRAGLDCNFVFPSHSLVSQVAAVAAGFGVMVMPRGRAVRNNLTIWEDSPLPKLPQLHGAIFVREGEDRTAIEELADHLRDEIHHDATSHRQRIAPAARAGG
jgi:DNA-binding transcriptional LysR family regulator